MVSISKVCSEQQGSYGNKGVAFYNKLWKRVENRRRYQKERKDRESNGVCGEDEASTRGDRVTLKKVQKDIKRQVDKGRRESEEWKREDRVLLSTKDLVFKERLARKLVDQFVGPYTIKKVVSTNVVKL